MRLQRGDDLGEQPVEVGVRRALNVQIPAADVAQRFVVVHDRDVRMFQHRMDAQDGVVGHDDGRGDLWARSYSEASFDFLP